MRISAYVPTLSNVALNPTENLQDLSKQGALYVYLVFQT